MDQIQKQGKLKSIYLKREDKTFGDLKQKKMSHIHS